VRQRSAVAGLLARMTNMNQRRVNKRIFMWSDEIPKKNWNHRVKNIFKNLHLAHFNDVNIIEPRPFIILVKVSAFNEYKQEWKNQLLSEHARTGNGRNKLRPSKLYKEEYKEASYLRTPMRRGHRSAFAKFRCGVAPLRVETGRYENIPFNERLCFNCQDTVRLVIGMILFMFYVIYVLLCLPMSET
jgi:hypothetical protein